MSFFERFSYTFRKHSFVRLAIFISVLLLSLIISLIITCASKKEPQLVAVEPQVANPGDTIQIYGNHFGAKINDSYVEIAGNRITASHYVSWSDNNIQVQLPQNIEDGFLYVVTANGKSKPINFTNKQTIPLIVKNDSSSTLPYISNIAEKNVSIGKLITITGKNFGPLRNNSKVFFSINSDSDDEENFISCEDSKFYYDFWSNQEIRVRVPDGACSGSFFVRSNQGDSNFYNIEIKNMPGTKQFSNKTTYLLSAKVEVASSEMKTASDIITHFPIPPEMPTQRKVEIPLSSPEPMISKYMQTIVQQKQILPRTKNNFVIENSYLVPIYSVFTSIEKNKIKPYSQETNKIFAEYLKQDFIVPADNEDVKNLGQILYGKLSNPYDIAKTIYNYLTNEISLLPDLRTENADIAQVIASHSADSYELTMLFCALCRNAKIPCIPLSGVYIDGEEKAHSHWWAKFYIEEFGWIPVDVVLGNGFLYPTKNEIDNPKEFYFGNMDSCHVTFSVGWNKIQSTNIKNFTDENAKTKMYALQSIWEETSADIQNIAFNWLDIAVLGIY